MLFGVLLLLALVWPPPAAAQPRAPDDVSQLVAELEAAGASGDTARITTLAESPQTRGLRSFTALAGPAPARFIIKERDRVALRTPGTRLLVEIFTERGGEATITSWRIDVLPGAGGALPRIADMEQLTTVSGLHRLALDSSKQFAISNLTVRGTDLTLTLASGSAFVAETADGPTAVVLLGRGRMQFAPSDAAERTQIRLFAGDAILAGEFDAAFVRLPPQEFEDVFSDGAMRPVAVAADALRRATAVFEDYVGETLTLDLRDLSRDRWSLVPPLGDLVVEIRTRRMGTLTYARSTKDAEDISLFNRGRRRNISVYASPRKLASRGPFYSEDELVEYDVLRQELDVAFTPDRAWVEGTAHLDLRVRSYAAASITLRLAEPLTVRSVTGGELGRLLHLRVIGQNSVIVNFPTTLARNDQLRLTIVYSGRLESQLSDRESVTVAQGNVQQEEVYIPAEPHYLYSNRSYWYPQNTVTDYAATRLAISVPGEYSVVASGAELTAPAATPERARRTFQYDSDLPIRYVAVVISRFTRAISRELPDVPHGAGAGTAPLRLTVMTNPRQGSRARSLADRAAAMLAFYAATIGDAPYPSFTLGVTESELPGGHSPAYFAILNQQLPFTPVTWRNDPVAFEDYPSYFLAHEIAHQWWGQGVGWKNYHEQWLSEGFAQYFAVLFAEHERGQNPFRGMLRQMRRWAIEHSAHGPVYLGYRLGHIRADGRIFRSLVYNKGAMVLHMLRRLVGDDAFFAGVRRFYADWKFRKAGTHDFRLAMERASGMDLGAFFDGWIYGSAIPVVAFSSSVSGRELRLRFEHRGEIVPTPVTVSIAYTDGTLEEVVVPVTGPAAELSVTLRGTPRSVAANRDGGAVVEIIR